MSKVKLDPHEIEKSLKNWYDIKQMILILEKKCEKAKKYIEYIMDTQDVNTLNLGPYQAKRRHDKRRMLYKKNVPKEIYNKYATDIEFTAYYIKKIKNKK